MLFGGKKQKRICLVICHLLLDVLPSPNNNSAIVQKIMHKHCSVQHLQQSAVDMSTKVGQTNLSMCFFPQLYFVF